MSAEDCRIYDIGAKVKIESKEGKMYTAKVSSQSNAELISKK
jgi:hypothetical protein